MKDINFRVVFNFFLMVMLLCSTCTYVSADTTVDNGSVLYVSPSGNDTNDGLTENTSKKNIQNAINNAADGAKIIIKPGTYKENLNITKNITLTSNNPKKTIINGQNNGTCITIPNGYNVTINGLTITNGKGRAGGGLFNSGYLILTNSIITKNAADPKPYYTSDGGKMPNDFGGGIANLGIMFVTDCTISKNTAESGGGICNQGFMKVVHSTIKKNKATSQGGGIHSEDSILEYCNIRGNIAKVNGGGIYFTNGDLSVDHCNITKNKAADGGGIYRTGIYCGNRGFMEVANSIISSNRAHRGAGLYNTGKIALSNTTIRWNDATYGGGIENDGECNSVYLYNCKIILNRALLGGGIRNVPEDHSYTMHVYADKKTLIMFNLFPWGSGEKIEPMRDRNGKKI